MTEQKRQQAVRLFMVVLALTALANGLGNNIFSDRKSTRLNSSHIH